MKKFRFLVFIDDDHPTNVYHKLILEESDLCEESKFFVSPVEALEFFKTLADEPDPVFPDAIFLDINLPMLSCWECIEEYQKLGIPESPGIIMLTTSRYVKDLERGERLAIVHNLISKPLEIEHLETVCQENL